MRGNRNAHSAHGPRQAMVSIYEKTRFRTARNRAFHLAHGRGQSARRGRLSRRAYPIPPSYLAAPILYPRPQPRHRLPKSGRGGGLGERKEREGWGQKGGGERGKRGGVSLSPVSPAQKSASVSNADIPETRLQHRNPPPVLESAFTRCGRIGWWRWR